MFCAYVKNIFKALKEGFVNVTGPNFEKTLTELIKSSENVPC